MQVTDKLNYPFTSYAGITYQAKDFQSPPKRAYHLKGKKIKVPTNYFTRQQLNTNQATYKRNVSSGASESTYQDWDGNFQGDYSTFAVGHANHDLVSTMLFEKNKKKRTNLIQQVLDLALLSQGMLKGEGLTSFISRSVNMIKK